MHGHLRGNTARTPRHVNGNVEQTEYTPVRLDQLLKPIRNQRRALPSCVTIDPQVPGDGDNGEAAVAERHGRASDPLVRQGRTGLAKNRSDR